MLFDPHAERTPEELIHWLWEHEWPADMKARIERVAAALGTTWFSIVVECLDQGTEHIEDPNMRRQVLAQWQRDALPFGKDPRVDEEA